MSMRSQLGGIRRRVLTALHRRPAPLGAYGPIVTFSFDDFPRSALTEGAEIIERFGARATYYVAMSLMNTRNDLGEQFCYNDLISLLDRGHEIASHTFSHLSARRASNEVFSKDVQRGEEEILKRLGVAASGNFAYPYGDVTLESKKMLGPEFISCRGTCGGLNGPDVDLNLLRANSLYGDMEGAEVAKRLVLENEAQRGWLIFYSHDVANLPSPFGCTPQLLEAICSFAAERKARLMTVAEVMRGLSQEPYTVFNESLQNRHKLRGDSFHEASARR